MRLQLDRIPISVKGRKINELMHRQHDSDLIGDGTYQSPGFLYFVDLADERFRLNNVFSQGRRLAGAFGFGNLQAPSS